MVLPILKPGPGLRSPAHRRGDHNLGDAKQTRACSIALHLGGHPICRLEPVDVGACACFVGCAALSLGGP